MDDEQTHPDEGAKKMISSEIHENDEATSGEVFAPEVSLTGDGAVRGPKIIPFRNLCRCGDEIWIENDGVIYRLRRTRLGKLILTK